MKTLCLITLLITANFVCRSSESTNADAFIKRAYDEWNPKITWGEATNFWTGDPSGKYLFIATFKAGIYVKNSVIVLSGNPPKVVSPVEIGFANISAIQTNYDHIDCTLPRTNEWLNLSMVDSSGVPIPKTAEGLALGQPPSLKPHTLWRHWGRYGYAAPMFPNEIDMGYDFDPTKYFILKQPGLYKLTIVQRLYVDDTNQFLKAITLPPVSVDVRVEK